MCSYCDINMAAPILGNTPITSVSGSPAAGNGDGDVVCGDAVGGAGFARGVGAPDCGAVLGLGVGAAATLVAFDFAVR